MTMTESCGAGHHRVDKVNDCEYRCWRCGADEQVMEREEETADPCTPCAGTGNAPDGRPCWACDGTGFADGFDQAVTV